MEEKEKIKEKVLEFVNEQIWNKILDCQDLHYKVIIEKAIDITIQEMQKEFDELKKENKELQKEQDGMLEIDYESVKELEDKLKGAEEQLKIEIENNLSESLQRDKDWRENVNKINYPKNQDILDIWNNKIITTFDFKNSVELQNNNSFRQLIYDAIQFGFDNCKKNLLESENKKEVVILDNNPLSIACYSEEFPENWKKLENSKKKRS